ncbi:MAG: hypothetical protein ABFD16_08765 [Thermoguttaceae bacterium]
MTTKLPRPSLLLAIVLFANSCWAADSVSRDAPASLDWVNDALVVAMPAAAVGGCQAGVYTPAENGVRPWRHAIIRWLTSRSVRGNGAVLVRQEASEGGAGLTAIVDPQAEYLFEVLVHLPGKGGGFGTPQDKDVEIVASVLDANDRVLAEAPVPLISGDWAPGQVSFASGAVREVRCVVHAKSPKRLPCLYFAEGFRLTRKDDAWWNPQNLFNASRTAARLPDQRELLVKTLDPDVVGGHNGVYLNWDGFFTQRGIAVGGGHWEQEYNHLAAADAVVEQFRDRGMARNVDGECLRGYANRLWPGYNMCHNAPAWHAYYKQRFTRIAPEVQFLSQDNICTPSFLCPGKGCFCQDCRDGFRDWLQRRWTPEQRHAAGIDDPASLDIVKYVKRVQERIAKGRDAVLADPVLRAYVEFSYASQIDRWRDAVAAAKQAAVHPIAVCGNQWGAGGSRPYSVALSQVSDMVFTEAEAECLRPQKRAEAVLVTKLGLAAGQYRRPVLLCLSSLFHAPQAAHCRLRAVAGQAWADGGRPMPWATAPGASGWFYDIEARLCRFVQEHRALFARRDRVANVGLVYSLPTHAWRQFPAFGLSSSQYQRWFAACARLLEEAHVPYEVNCWWHPLLGDDRASLERLDRYQVLVLPGVDCFTDAQQEAVRAFQARGGRVISLACPTLYDADATPRPAGQTLVAPGEPALEIAPDLLTRYARAGEKLPAENAADAQTADNELQATLSRAMAEDRMLQTDAPASVWANLWLDATRQVLSLHLVNGNIDEQADRFRPVAKSRWRVRLPAGVSVDRAVVITPDEAAPPSRATPLPVEVSKGWATVVVPRIESYTVVALYAGEALTAANHAANNRRAVWRASVTRDAKPDTTPDANVTPRP